MEQEKILITQSGLEKYKAEYRHLIDIDIPANVEALQLARSNGDLSENADYDAARNKQAELESRRKELEYYLNNYQLINDNAGDKKDKKVRLGSTVEVEDLSDNTTTSYSIVGTVEADPFKGRISQDCELGKALLGAKAGEVVTVKVAHPYDVKVLKVEN